MFMEYSDNKKRGFTLLELLLYVSIASIMLFVISAFLAILLESRVKNKTIAEVDGQGVYVMQLLTQTIRNAKSITSPAIGTTANFLNLEMSLSSNDPTIFDEVGGVVQITEAANSAINLTSSRITASNIVFSNLSQVDTPGTVRVEFTLTHKNPEGRKEYEYEKVFIGSASLRGGTTAAVPPTPPPSCDTQADDLVVDISGANIGGGGNKELQGVTVQNIDTIGTCDIVIDKTTLTWGNGQLIEEVTIGGTTIWKRVGNIGTPTGRQPTGTELDNVDYTITSGSTDSVDKFKFNGNMIGDTFTITFTMVDGSTKVISSFSP